MSSGFGSSVDASCCAARKLRLSFPSACSSARVDDGRPMTKGIIMCGNTTTSRSGTMGRVSITSAFSLSRPNTGGGALAYLLDQRNGLLPVQDDLAGHHALFHLLHRGQVVHQVEHQVLDDH